jgi:hypothetical protein
MRSKAAKMVTGAAACSVLALGLATAGAGGAAAQEKKTYAMVFQVLNNAFTPPLKQGCEDAARELGVECIFMGPPEYDEAGPGAHGAGHAHAGRRRARDLGREPEGDGPRAEAGAGPEGAGGACSTATCCRRTRASG